MYKEINEEEKDSFLSHFCVSHLHSNTLTLNTLSAHKGGKQEQFLFFDFTNGTCSFRLRRISDKNRRLLPGIESPMQKLSLLNILEDLEIQRTDVIA